MTKRNDIEKIFEVVLAFNSALRYEELLDTILDKLMDVTASDGGTLYTLEDEMLHFRIIKNQTMNIYQSADDKIDLPPITLNENNIQNASAYSAIKNEIIIIDDVYESERFNFSGPKNWDKQTGYRTRSMLVLPLTTFRNEEPEVLGVIQLINSTDENGNFVPYGDIFTVPVIPALAKVAANTLSNLTHIHEIRSVFQSFVETMVKTIDERSKYNSNHTLRVAGYCTGFARYLSSRFPKGHPFNFDEKRIEELSMAAMLHDIGKIATPIHILDKADRLSGRLQVIRGRFESLFLFLEIKMLRAQISEDEYNAQVAELIDAQHLIESANIAGFLPDESIEKIKLFAKTKFTNHKEEAFILLDPQDIESLSISKGTLTPAEREIIKEHAATTGRILRNISFRKYYKNVAEWALSHHEFLDGTGYPRGLCGDELPIEVCILTIMDIYEALTADDRPYKKAMSTNKAFFILDAMVKEGKLHEELVQLFHESGVWQG